MAQRTAAVVVLGVILAAVVSYEFGYSVGISRGPTVTATTSILLSANRTGTQVLSPVESQSVALTTTPSGPIKHVVIIVMENKEYDGVIGSADAPYENQLASKFALAGSYYAVSHPSLPNYIALIAGATFGVDSDCPPSQCPFPYNVGTITKLLDAHRLSWREYAESMPVNCSQTDSADGLYVAKHDPFVYFSSITGNYGVGGASSYCDSHVLPLDQFWLDNTQGKLPAFAIITPNICDDAHSCTLSAGDQWLSIELPLIINPNSPSYSSMALFVVYDEGFSSQGFGDAEGGHVVCLLVSPFAKPGYVSTVKYSHYSLLATVEGIFNLGNLGRNDASASVMSDLFSSGVLGA